MLSFFSLMAFQVITLSNTFEFYFFLIFCKFNVNDVKTPAFPKAC